MGSTIDDADLAAVFGPLRNPPPLHCLLAFEAAGRSLSLAKAAGELRLTPSALAQSIALLEDRVGLHLVHALSPAVELTMVGQQYLRAVQQFTHRMRDDLYERLPGRRTQLRITASQAFARLWLAPRLGGFVQRHPRIDLVLASTAQFQTIGHGGVDIGLRYGHVDDDRLLATTLWTDRLVAVGAPALLAQGSIDPIAIGRDMPLIDHAVARWGPWLEAANAPGSGFRPVLVCSDLHLAIEAACQGIGLMLAPSRLLEHKQRGELTIASRHTIAAKPYQAVVAREQADRLPVREFMQWLTAEVAAQERRLTRQTPRAG